MKKRNKEFLIAFVVAVIFFIISLIVQYYFSVEVAINAMIGIALSAGFYGFVCAIGIIYITSPENKEKFSIDIFILKLFMTFFSLSMLFILSTIGNLLLSNISTICFIVGFVLVMVWIIYLAIKELIKEYKKYKEKQ